MALHEGGFFRPIVKGLARLATRPRPETTGEYGGSPPWQAAEADPQTRPGAPAGAGVRANAPAPAAAPSAVEEVVERYLDCGNPRRGFALMTLLKGVKRI